MNRINRSIAPADSSPVQRRNFLLVQLEAFGVGIANAAVPFMGVFLAKLGATSLQLGLSSSLPSLTGFLLAIPVGRTMQNRRNIISWYSVSRLLYIFSYTLTGFIPFLLPSEFVIPAILILGVFATLPNTVLTLSFSVTMNAVSGPGKRFELMSRRWSILGITTAITVALVGLFLERHEFPINYQVAFIALSLGGVVSYFFARRIVLPETAIQAEQTELPARNLFRDAWEKVSKEPRFLSFTAKRSIFLFGMSLAGPMIPLYYVDVVNAPDAWIGIFGTVQTAIMLIGYYFWTRQSRKRGTHFVLLSTTFGLALFPAALSSTTSVQVIAVLVGITGILQAGNDLVFFEELMKTVPSEHSPLFISFAQTSQYLAAIVSPLVGSYLANTMGVEAALIFTSGVRIIGFLAFLVGKPGKEDSEGARSD